MATAERYRGTNWLGLAFRPLRDMFVFSGRSTRSEVVAFFILGSLANMSTVTVLSDDVVGVLLMAMKVVWNAFWQFPWVALFVRRLHDQNRSGWVALVLAAIFVTAWAFLWTLPDDPGSKMRVSFSGLPSRHPELNPITVTLFVTMMVTLFVQLVLFLFPPTPGPNRYGPDPRLDEA